MSESENPFGAFEGQKPENAEQSEASSLPSAAPGFDRDGRYQELVAQGVSEADAAEQADYEQRTYNDKQGTSHTG